MASRGKQHADQVPLPYWRAALAEVSLLHPDVPAESKPILIGRSEGGWAVTHALPSVGEWAAAQFSASKSASSRSRTIPYVLIAARLSEKSSHGVKTRSANLHKGHSILCVPCLLDRAGNLSPDPDRHPWIPRVLLEPTMQVSVGALSAYDQFVSRLPPKPRTMEDVLLAAADLFRAVTDANLPCTLCDLDEPYGEVFAIDGFEVVCEWHGVPYDPPVIAKQLINLYDQIIEAKPSIPLMDKLREVSEQTSRPPLDVASSEVAYTRTLGHMSGRHWLSPSQRESMVELSQLKDGQILAVNGPPGTGKTTLLQSVVAQLWVDAAIRQAACPLIVVTSTNGTALETVLDSFAKIGKDIEQQRWHPYDKGMGLFMPSKSRDTKHPTYTGNAHAFAEHETPSGVEHAEKFFLERATAYFGKTPSGVRGAVNDLHAELMALKRRLKLIINARFELYRATGQSLDEGAQTACHRLLSELQDAKTGHETRLAQADEDLRWCDEQRLQAKTRYAEKCTEINQAEQAWNAYLGSSPLWLDLLSFLSVIKKRRAARDRQVLLSCALTAECHDRDSDLVAKFNEHRARAQADLETALEFVTGRAQDADKIRLAALATLRELAQAQSNLQKVQQRWVDALKEHIDLQDVSLSKLNEALDLKIRAPMFRLADWYWSGQWILEMKTRLAEGQVDSKGPARREAQYRRFAKLSPCIVSNFHAAPSYFTAWITRETPVPLWNMIDLLIVDEAGQVAPEVGAPLFSLAKRALVVGDVHQIEPVWNTGEAIDRTNAASLGWIADHMDRRYESLSNDGYTSAHGNLMKMANRACGVQKYPDARGLMLTEHRRCVPELIDYCNQLVYAGRLEPVRKTLAPDERLLPTFGHLNVSGRDRSVGGSRSNPTQAQAIVDWICANRARIEAHYSRKANAPKGLSELLGVVTPFSSQAAAIQRMLYRAMPDLGASKATRLTVGTVHALQGAERDIVIFSPTYGETFSGGAFFDEKVNMLNVAVSRARDSFIVIGRLDLFDVTKRSLPSGLLARYLFDPEHGAAL